MRRERVLAYLHLVAGIPGLVLGEADARDLRVAVADAGNVVVPHRMLRHTGDPLRGDDAFVGSLVREHGLSGNVADRIDARDAALTPLVDLDPRAVHFDAQRFEPQALSDWLPPDGHEENVGLDLLLALARLDGEHHRAGFAVQRYDLRAGLDRHATLLERPREGLADLGIRYRDQRVEHFDHGNVHPERVEHVRELDAHVAAAHHDHALGKVTERQSFAASDHPITVDLEARERSHRRAGGDDDVRGLDGVAVTLLRSDLDNARPSDQAPSLEQLHVVLLEQEPDAAGELLADKPTSVHGRAHVVHDILGPHAHFLAVRLEVLGQRSTLEQCLGGNAPPVQTRAPETAFVGGSLDAAGLQAQLGRPDRADVAGRTGSDHQYVELFSHRFASFVSCPGVCRAESGLLVARAPARADSPASP